MKTRIIYTKFWYDNYISSLKHKEKLAFLYFITNEKVNICGIYELPDKYIKIDLDLKQNELDKIKDKFQEDNKLLFIDGWVKIKNFELYNKFDGEKNVVAKRKEINLIPRKVIDYQYSIDRVSPKSDTLNNHKSIINNHKSESESESITRKQDELTFNFSTFKFENLLKTDKVEWRKIYDKVDIEKEILKMVNWLKIHQAEKRTHKKNWRKFITNWLNRCQIDLTEGVKNRELIEKMIKGSGIGDIKDLDNPEFIDLAKKCYKELNKTCNVTYNKKLNIKCIICLEKRGTFK